MMGKDEDASEPDETWAAGLEVLLDLATTVIEDAHHAGVAAVSGGQGAQFARAAVLRQAGADLVIIAEACEVFVRRQHRR